MQHPEGGSVGEIANLDWHSELKGFYLGINKPDKLPYLNEMLVHHEGREEQMLSHLMMKYKRIIPESLANHLDTLQGFLETSNVNAVEEISNLISAQRAYEMNSKVIQTSDEMLGTLTAMR